MGSRCQFNGQSRREGGFTLLEIIVSVGLMGMIIFGIAALASRMTEESKATVVADHLKAVGEGARSYIKSNFATVASNATATTPALIRVSDLIASGDLPTGFSVTNPEGQPTCVLVLEPTSNKLEALVVTQGGNTIDDVSLGQIAGNIGGDAGGIYAAASTLIKGSLGGWQFAPGNYANANHLGQNCSGATGSVTFAAGHPMMALWFADGDSISGTLYRNAIPGDPSLNTMSTPILMDPAFTTVVQGAACGSVPNGAIARDASGRLASCVSGTWQRAGSAFWHDPVANFASLPGVDDVGAVRLTRDTNRAFAWDGGGWRPLAIDQNGNLNVPGTLTAGTVNTGTANVGGNANIGGTMTAGAANVGGNANIGGTMTAGAANVSGNTNTNTMTLSSTNVIGGGCGPTGIMSKDPSGLILSCQGGIWKSGLAGTFTLVSPPSRIATCPAGSQLLIGSCYGRDNCSGNDWSGHGGIPDVANNRWICADWHCNSTYAFALCKW